jgi:LuxR family maltose regulon positive regulatory protein
MGESEQGREPAVSQLLVTKLHPPPSREQTVPRDRLVERLRVGPGIRLAVVAAPAGSGKTTLLGAWREVEDAVRPVAWLTLDEGDDDPVVLWSYVLAALRKVLPGLRISTSPERAGPARIVDVVLPQLINQLSAAGEVALVLDDFHRLSGGPARDSVAWFIDHAPSTFRLVLATRSEPGFTLAALRAHGALLELRAAELGFTRAEADELLNNRLALGLEPESVDGLLERTEGWPAGLYLAALSLEGVDDRDAFARTFGGESRHVVDFLVDEVLEAHDSATRDLMLRTSILGRLCGPLCDAVLGQEGSDRLLAGLANTNLFLIPLDNRGIWYRFHHLFAQLLRVELEHREPGLTPSLHRRAFAWHRDHGSVDEAVGHALQAGAFSEAGDLVATVWKDYAGAGRHATVRTWLERFPVELLRENALLLLVDAWIHSLEGKREAAEAAIAAFEQLEQLERPEAGRLPDGFSSLESSLATLRGTFPWGNVSVGLRYARRAAELEGRASPWRSFVCLSVGMILYRSGEFEEADEWLAQAAELTLSREQWRWAVSSLSTRSLVAGELGRSDEQALHAQQAVALARRHGLEEVEGELFGALGASLMTRREFDQALAAFERGVVVARLAGHPIIVADLLIRQAALLRAIDRKDALAAVLDDARAALDACPDPGFLAKRLAALERPPKKHRRRQEGALSDRELHILRMLGGPLSERDISRELYLSHNTVHGHTKSIYRKLGVSSRQEALHHARELGLV